jgi:hypothetical protein
MKKPVTADPKKPLGRISIPGDLFDEIRQRASWQHVTLADYVQRALRKENRAVLRLQQQHEHQQRHQRNHQGCAA